MEFKVADIARHNREATRDRGGSYIDISPIAIFTFGDEACGLQGCDVINRNEPIAGKAKNDARKPIFQPDFL